MTDSLALEIYQGREPDLEPAGVNVVIDVLRAFTTVHVALASDCDEVLLAETVDEAFELADRHPDYLLAGERNARKVEGFDAGNSPTVVSRVDFGGEGAAGMILTTTNGVRATLNALSGEHVLVTGWSNVPATVDSIRAVAPDLERERIQLVASHPVSDEDVACAEYISARLRDSDGPDPETVVARIRAARSAQKFYSRQFRLRDLDLACRQTSASFAMVVQSDGETPRIRPRSVDG